MAKNKKISVLLPDSEAERFSDFCRLRGHKKSTLIARLIREHLEREGFQWQYPLASAEQSQQRK